MWMKQMRLIAFLLLTWLCRVCRVGMDCWITRRLKRGSFQTSRVSSLRIRRCEVLPRTKSYSLIHSYSSHHDLGHGEPSDCLVEKTRTQIVSRSFSCRPKHDSRVSCFCCVSKTDKITCLSCLSHLPDWAFSGLRSPRTSLPRCDT